MAAAGECYRCKGMLTLQGNANGAVFLKNNNAWLSTVQSLVLWTLCVLGRRSTNITCIPDVHDADTFNYSQLPLRTVHYTTLILCSTSLLNNFVKMNR